MSSTTPCRTKGRTRGRAQRWAPLLALATLVALSACDGGSTPPAAEPAPAPSTPASGETTTAPAPTPAPAAAGSPAPAPAPEVDPRLARLPAHLADANLNAGRRVFTQCRSCHLIGGGNHSVGPNLEGVFGRVVGTMDGFTYSDAVQAADFVWTPEQLDNWLSDPRGFLPGNNMTFVGVRNETQRKDLIAWLMLETGALDAPVEDAPVEDAPVE